MMISRIGAVDRVERSAHSGTVRRCVCRERCAVARAAAAWLDSTTSCRCFEGKWRQRQQRALRWLMGGATLLQQPPTNCKSMPARVHPCDCI